MKWIPRRSVTADPRATVRQRARLAKPRLSSHSRTLSADSRQDATRGDSPLTRAVVASLHRADPPRTPPLLPDRLAAVSAVIRFGRAGGRCEAAGGHTAG